MPESGPPEFPPWLALRLRLDRLGTVESRCGAVAVGLVCLLPPLSSGGARVTCAVAPFPHPAHRTGRADLPHPALGQDVTPSHSPSHATARAQAYETEVPVQVREWIGPAPSSPELVLMAQPPAQPRSRVGVECTIRTAGRSDTEVVRPAAQRAVQLAHQLRGLLPRQ